MHYAVGDDEEDPLNFDALCEFRDEKWLSTLVLHLELIILLYVHPL